MSIPIAGTSGPDAASVGGSGAGTATSKINPWVGSDDASGSSQTTPAALAQVVPPPQQQPAQQTQQSTPQVPPGTTMVNEPQQGQQQQAATQAQPAQSPQQLNLSNLSAEQFAQLVAVAAQQGVNLHAQQAQQQQAQQQAQPQLSPEEIERQFNVVKPTEQDVSKIFAGGADAVATLQNLLHGAAKMATTIAAFSANRQMQQLRAELQQQLAPVNQASQQHLMETHTKAFYGKYPELNSQNYHPVLMTVYQQLERSGFRGTPEQVYQKVADEAKRLITAVNPQAFAGTQQTGQQQTSQQQQQQPSTSGMATLPTGGGSSSAPHSASGGSNTAKRLFS
jgi:hypothetical protein